MGELETTGGTGGPGGGGFDPPRGDEGLDDWLTRRLEAQGIVANRAGFPTARILAVLGLVVALIALFWVISGAGGSSQSAGPTTTQPTGTTGTTGTTGSTGGGKKHSTKIDWRTIPLTVLNGYGATGAAGAAQQQLTTQGWKVVAASNASTSSITQTVVVYAPGKLRDAKVVAKRLHLPAPVALADTTGVAAAPEGGVAILLGSDGLPAVAG
jgi:LytR cell envelope-related transcriptional attenuator